MRSDQSQKRSIVCYIAETDGSKHFTHVELPVKMLPIEQVTLMGLMGGPTLNSLMIDIRVNNPSSSDHAVQIANKAISTILDRIAYFYDIGIGKPQPACVISQIVREDGSTEEVNRTNLGTSTHQDSSFHSYSQADPELISLLNSPLTYERDLYYKQYRTAIQSDDAVAQYMLLYGILVQKFDDSQREVDKFIRKIEPQVQRLERQFEGAERPPKEETIYTSLRNDIAHARPGKTFEETIEKIEANLEKLRGLTKKAIE